MVEQIQSQSPYYIRQQWSDDRMAGSVPVWQNNAGQGKEVAANAMSLSGGASGGVTAPSLSFGELLDVVNPLHHIPVVSSVYRSLTGDTISPVASIAGGALYGGPLGAGMSLVNAAMEEHAGGSLANAVVDAGKRPAHYGAQEEARTAGLNKRHTQSDSSSVEKAPRVAAAVVPSSKPYQPIHNVKDVYDAMDFAPVEKVVIAQAETDTRQRWNFNT